MTYHVTSRVRPGRSERQRGRILLAIAFVAAAGIVSMIVWRTNLASGGEPPQRLTLISTGFSAGGMIPSLYTCAGRNISPALRWSSPPAGTRSFALIVTDPDAPSGTFTHWVAFNLSPGQRDLAEGVPKSSQIPIGGQQGSNDFENIGYGGPCPPPGSPHHYRFSLYALNTRLPLKPGATREQVERAMKGHILGEAELVGLFGR